MKHLEWSLSDSYQQQYTGVSQGLASFVSVEVKGLASTLPAAQECAIEQIGNCCAVIEETLGVYANYFREWRFECPLVRQFAKTRKNGLPRINPLVDISLLCEMRFGVLMGIHDMARISGPLVYDCARAGEGFEGMRTPISLRANEIVLRDQKGVVASYFQGADKRTCVTPTTEDVVVFAFGAPGISKARLGEALAAASEILAPHSASSMMDLRGIS